MPVSETIIIDATLYAFMNRTFESLFVEVVCHSIHVIFTGTTLALHLRSEFLQVHICLVFELYCNFPAQNTVCWFVFIFSGMDAVCL